MKAIIIIFICFNKQQYNQNQFNNNQINLFNTLKFILVMRNKINSLELIIQY